LKQLQTDIGTIHFVGIGGIGMSGIAEVMKNLGYRVQGSDVAEGYVVQGLRDKGIPVAIGHDAGNLGDAAVVVVSTAIVRSNPEVESALERRIPVVRRAEMLAELMRLKSTVAVAGTHGKTTTTSMIAALLDAGGVDPTVINGGIINSYGSNARLGASDWMVVEADESDGSFLRLDGTVAVVTNIDPEHLDHYGSFDAVKDAFVEFVENVPFYGAALLCLDHPEVQGILPRLRDRRIVTYGFSAQADVRGVNVQPVKGGNRFEVIVRERDGGTRSIEDIELPMPGRHNVQNALAAIGVALELGIDDATIQRGFHLFGGVKRRFTKVGEVPCADGGGATIIDDYGHHPVEIRAVLAAARESAVGRVFAVVQPHRYSRLGSLMEEFQTAFNDADRVLVTPVYAAGEAPVAGVDAQALVDGLKRRGHRGAAPVADADALAAELAGELRAGDQVVCLGAGDITKWAAGLANGIVAKLPSRLREGLGEGMSA
jgi:UDP-N-acetylmuramate--alanine ligase